MKASNLSEDGKREPLSKNWKVWSAISPQLTVLYKRNREGIVSTPLFIHPVETDFPRNLTEQQRFFRKYPTSDIIPTTAERLRFYRYKNNLMQKEVAEYLGIDRTTYVTYEDPERDYYYPEHLEALSVLYEIPLEAILDDYNLFLHNGQARQLKALRKHYRLTQHELGKILGLSRTSIRKWENKSVRLSKASYEKLFVDDCLNTKELAVL